MRHTTTDVDHGATVETFPVGDGRDYPAWNLRLPSGLLVMVGRHDVENGSQLYVSINTEEVERSEHDADGCPLLNVEINGGPVYDRERKQEAI